MIFQIRWTEKEAEKLSSLIEEVVADTEEEAIEKCHDQNPHEWGQWDFINRTISGRKFFISPIEKHRGYFCI